MIPPLLPDAALVARIDAVLPQTQCTRCGEADCAAYAAGVAAGMSINRCPPGGAEGVRRLAELTGRTVEAIDPACGKEGPRSVAWIDEAACIGCTLCIKACPVDCIVGAPKRMHTIVEALCTGCELCLPACPVDCIHLDIATPGSSGWAAWSNAQAGEARERYAARNQRRAGAAERSRQRLAEKALPAPMSANAGPPDPLTCSTSENLNIAAVLATARARRSS